MRIILIVAVFLVFIGGTAVFLRLDRDAQNITPLSDAPITPLMLRTALIGANINIPMDTGNGMQPVPVLLDEYISFDEPVLGGTYIDTEEPERQATVMIPEFADVPRGASVLDVSDATATPDDAVAFSRFAVAPLYVNFGGSGTFLMIGLFEINQDGELIHRDVQFIDDRVPFEGFEAEDTAEGPVIRVHYRTRGVGDAMSDTPMYPATRTLRRDGGNLLLID